MSARRMREAAAREVAEHLSTPEDVIWAEDAASRIRSLPLPSSTDEDVERVARVIYALLEGEVASADFGRQLRQWDRALDLARAAIAAYEEGGE